MKWRIVSNGEKFRAQFKRGIIGWTDANMLRFDGSSTYSVNLEFDHFTDAMAYVDEQVSKANPKPWVEVWPASQMEGSQK